MAARRTPALAGTADPLVGLSQYEKRLRRELNNPSVGEDETLELSNLLGPCIAFLRQQDRCESRVGTELQMHQVPDGLAGTQATGELLDLVPALECRNYLANSRLGAHLNAKNALAARMGGG